MKSKKKAGLHRENPAKRETAPPQHLLIHETVSNSKAKGNSSFTKACIHWEIII